MLESGSFNTQPNSLLKVKSWPYRPGHGAWAEQIRLISEEGCVAACAAV